MPSACRTQTANLIAESDSGPERVPTAPRPDWPPSSAACRPGRAPTEFSSRQSSGVHDPLARPAAVERRLARVDWPAAGVNSLPAPARAEFESPMELTSMDGRCWKISARRMAGRSRRVVRSPKVLSRRFDRDAKRCSSTERFSSVPPVMALIEPPHHPCSGPIGSEPIANCRHLSTRTLAAPHPRLCRHHLGRPPPKRLHHRARCQRSEPPAD